MGFATHPDGSMDFDIRATLSPLPRIWTCSRCRTEGQLAFRASGWAVVCPCPNCPAPAVPESEYNPTPLAAIRHWNWKQGGPK